MAKVKAKDANVKNALERAIAAAGSAAELSRRLGITHSALSQWRGTPPVKRCPEIERLTGVSCRDLRPDFFRRSAR